MGYTVERDYFEASSRAVSCRCIFLSPATHDEYDVFVSWHIARSHKDMTHVC